MKTLVLLSLVLSLGACSREQVPTESTETEVPGTTAVQDVNPITAQTWLDGFALGSRLGPDGTIAEDAAASEFAPGDPIHLTMQTGDAPPAAAVEVVWTGPGERVLAEELQNVAAGQKQMRFQAPDTSAWPPGAYRVDVRVGDENVSTQQFTIVEGE